MYEITSRLYEETAERLCDAIGSGNSIPDYVDPEKYMLMVETVRKWRGDYE